MTEGFEAEGQIMRLDEHRGGVCELATADRAGRCALLVLDVTDARTHAALAEIGEGAEVHVSGYQDGTRLVPTQARGRRAA